MHIREKDSCIVLSSVKKVECELPITNGKPGSMKRLVNVVMLAILIFGMFSCANDELTDTFSSRGAEQDKNIIDSSSKELDNELLALSETVFSKACHSMAMRLEGKDTGGNIALFASIINIGELMYENETNDCYFDELTNITFNEKGYCNSLKEAGCGVWQWDGQLETFIKVKEHDTEISYKFPATDDLLGDTACLTITDLVLNNGNFPNKGAILEDGSVLNEMISNLKLNIKVKNELILTSNISNQFDNDGYFKIVAMTFNPKPFTFTGEMGRETQNGYWILAFNRENESIFEHNLAVRFDNAGDQITINNLVNHLNIKNIIITTEASTSEIYHKLHEVDEMQEDSEEHAIALAKILNENATMLVMHTHDYTVLAKITAVAKKNIEAINQNSWWVDLEFEFSDGSTVSGEEYFKDYLTTFKVELEKVVGEFEYKFGV